MVRTPSSVRPLGGEPDPDRPVRAAPDRAEARREADRAMAERAAAERAADEADTRLIAEGQQRLAWADRMSARETPRPAPAGQMDSTVELERPADRYGEEPEPGRKARVSVLATLGLVAGVAAVLVAFTGLLSAWGIVLGAIAVLLSIGGISATGRRHVAGKSNALTGLVLGLGAMVLGVVALTGAWSALTTDTNMVRQVRDWLDTLLFVQV